MLTIRFYHGNYWNPLHLLIMAVTRSRVVHCDFTYDVGFIRTQVESTQDGVRTFSCDANGSFGCVCRTWNGINYEFDGILTDSDIRPLLKTPYDYRAGLAYIWPWVRQSPKRMNCVEVCLWAMQKAGLPTPKYLPTPGGLLRWCEKLKRGEVRC